jgi:hypothetical protein
VKVEMTKDHILAEIRRTAAANGGVPLGQARFSTETGIRYSDWHGKYWARFGDAVREAGFTPNQLNSAYSDSDLLDKLAALTRELGRFPVAGELRLKARADKTFPSHNVFHRLGKKAELARKLQEHCEARGFRDVAAICAPVATADAEGDEDKATTAPTQFGWVYLLKSGRYHKIGRTNAVGRRERELAIQLPERAVVVHSIKTDDPAGIEDYWHRRFNDRHKNGEWFELTAADIAAFKRRRFM